MCAHVWSTFKSIVGFVFWPLCIISNSSSSGSDREKEPITTARRLFFHTTLGEGGGRGDSVDSGKAKMRNQHQSFLPLS